MIGLRVKLSGRFVGMSQNAPLTKFIERVAVTNAQGVAEALAFDGEFTGEVLVCAKPLDPALVLRAENGPEARLTLFEPPDRLINGFPLWLDASGRAERVVVLLEGFDFTDAFMAIQTLNLVRDAFDALRSSGVALLVVSYKTAHAAPDVLAREAEAAVRTASEVSGGRSVALAGLSAGGIVARWAMCLAESRGAPLPVHTLLTLDSPHRGARIHPKLQALAAAYGGPVYRKAILCDAARTLMSETLADPARDVSWRYVGQRPLGYKLPESVRTTTRFHDESFARLRSLAKNGYPTTCKTVGVANSNRTVGHGARKILRVWLPLNHFWTLETEAADRAPGSLLPKAARTYAFHLPLGIGGATLPELPTFLPAASALDAGPGEKPPFDAFYERPPTEKPVPHDEIAPDVVRFVVGELLRWN